MTRLSSPAYLLDDDLAKWLDVDGICQDFIPTDEEIHLSPPRNELQRTKPIETENTYQMGNSQPSISQEKVNKSTLKQKGSNLTRNRNLPEYSVICFPSNPAKPDGIKKKRKDFTEKRRLEVAQVRKTGACFRCKMRRISVRFEPPETSEGGAVRGDRADESDDE